jgi:hypothetical protein
MAAARALDQQLRTHDTKPRPPLVHCLPMKGDLMAKANSVKNFLTKLATDPETLGKFMLNPERTMQEAKIDKKHWVHIKNSVAHYYHRKLATPEEYALVC